MRTWSERRMQKQSVNMTQPPVEAEEEDGEERGAHTSPARLPLLLDVCRRLPTDSLGIASHGRVQWYLHRTRST